MPSQIIRRLAFAAASLFFASAAHATVITSYDVKNAWLSGYGGWQYSYTGGSSTINSNGSVNYAGGSGTLSDGIVGTSNATSELFTTGQQAVITLHLDAPATIDDISLFGGNIAGNSIPGLLNGATVTINGTSVTLASVGFGTGCSSGYCNDKLTLSSTALSGLVTDTIILSNITSTNYYFSIAEITINGKAATAVPEPASLALFALGMSAVGAARRRRKAQ